MHKRAIGNDFHLLSKQQRICIIQKIEKRKITFQIIFYTLSLVLSLAFSFFAYNFLILHLSPNFLTGYFFLFLIFVICFVVLLSTSRTICNTVGINIEKEIEKALSSTSPTT